MTDHSNHFQLFFSHKLQVIRSAMIWAVPVLMFWSGLQLISAILNLLSVAPELSAYLHQINVHSVYIIPYCLTIAVTCMLALQLHLPRPTMALISLGFLGTVFVALNERTDVAYVLSYFSAIIIPFISMPIVAYFYNQPWSRIIRTDAAGHSMRTNLNLIIPALLAGGVIIALILCSIPIFKLIAPDAINLDFVSNNRLLSKIIYTLLNSSLWSVGIHGYYALVPLMESIDAASPYHDSITFLGTFVFLGGSGATFSLVIAMLLFSRAKTQRVIALACLPLAFFNINELLLFGLPIIFNPRLFFPFLLVPVVNLLVAFNAFDQGLLSLSHIEVPFNSPVILNAWLATDGDPHAILLQLICLFIGVLIYAPFVLIYNQQIEDETIYFKSFDTSFSRLYEEAKTTMDDPVRIKYERAKEYNQTTQQLKKFSDDDFFLEYQPQIHPLSGQVTGCEALIRLRSVSGEITYPNHFLPWFAKAGMIKEIDKWVVKRALEQSSQWRLQGFKFPITVNLDANSLSDKKIVKDIVHLLKEDNSSHINFEVTEHSISKNLKQMQSTLSKLRKAGANIYIDDFGTGYSSINSLHLLPIDGIKIDRSFVLALKDKRGVKVFEGLMKFTKELDFKIIVEGVETEDQLKLAKRHHEAIIQGWYYSKSLCPDEFLTFASNINNAKDPHRAIDKEASSS